MQALTRKLILVFVFAATLIYELGQGAVSHLLEITSGVTAYQVFQRDTHNQARIVVRGNCNLNDCRTIEARVVGRDGEVPGLGWTAIANSTSGRWKGEVPGIPTGGPYRLEFRARTGSQAVAGETAVDGVLIGDLWILAGQSNMDGRGELTDAEEPDERVHNFDLADRWSVAREPIADRLAATDGAQWIARDSQNRRRPYTPTEVANIRATRTKGTSLAMTFAKQMVARTQVPIGLIPCSRGGASLEDWSPTGKTEGTASLYGAMLRRHAAVGGRVTGMLWYQGEHEALDKSSPTYAMRFKAFLGAVRTDFGQPDLPIYYVQLARLLRADPTGWNEVQVAQLDIERGVSHVRLAAAVDLDLVDEIHVNSAGLKRLGRRVSNLACADLFPERCPDLKQGPRPASLRIEESDRDWAVLALTFSGVNGRLVQRGRLGGFSIRNREGADLFAVYSATLDPRRPDTIILRVNGKSISHDAMLWYGWGNDPYCNVLDERDMAAPVFAIPIPSV